MDNLERHKELLSEFEDKLGIDFEDKKLLFQCLIHDSYAYENEEVKKSNERLEFLGDAVLGLVISHLLHQFNPDWNEGQMALYKSNLVSADYLAGRARSMDLGRFLLLGKGEEAHGGRERTSILSDCMEAFIGAHYLDQGYEKTFIIIQRLYEGCIDATEPPKDFKSSLQEYSQKLYRSLPSYRVVNEEGPPHLKTFRVEVSLENGSRGAGEGSSKKEAEQEAAKDVLSRINEK